MAQRITVQGMVAHYKKLEDYMTPRGFGDEAEKQNLIRTQSFVEGTLSPMNTGMVVTSNKALTQNGRIWNAHTLVFEGKKKRDPLELVVNYTTASNAEVALGLTLGEALPKAKLSRTVKVIFHPEAESEKLFSKWVVQATKQGEGLSLAYDGIDWEYLQEQATQYILDLQVRE